MATITLSLSTKINKVSKKSEILIRFVGSREHIFRCKSRLFISPSRWNKTDQKINIPRIATPEQIALIKIQSQLDNLKNVIIESYSSIDKKMIDKSWLDILIDKFHNPEKYNKSSILVETSFIDLFFTFIESYKLSNVRKKNYKVIGRELQRFELYQQITTDLNFRLTLDGINFETLVQFEKFLKKEYQYCTMPKFKIIYETFPETRTPQPRGQNTINDVHKKFRTFFNWANNNGYTNNNPYKKFKIVECIYGRPIYITIEERNQIYKKDISNNSNLEIQRDIFIFQCLIGCRVSDLYKLKKSNIINEAIEYIPRKTKDDRPETVRVPLNETAKEILIRYENYDGIYLFPFISEQKYNNAIKKIFELAEVTRFVTVINPTTREEEKRPINEIASSHLARRTFCGNLYKQVKDPNLVGSLSGHAEGSKAFARYRDIDEDMKKDLVKLLD